MAYASMTNPIHSTVSIRSWARRLRIQTRVGVTLAPALEHPEIGRYDHQSFKQTLEHDQLTQPGQRNVSLA